MQAYTTVLEKLEAANLGSTQSPELLNNVGCLHHQLGNQAPAQLHYEKALLSCAEMRGAGAEGEDLVYLESISVTIKCVGCPALVCRSRVRLAWFNCRVSPSGLV
jgi:hypothetical protein